MSSRRPTRRKAAGRINYNVDVLSSAFDIDGHGEGRLKKRKISAKVANMSGSRSNKRTRKMMTTAEKERLADGKQPYQGAGKRAPAAEILSERAPLPTRSKNGELVFRDYPEFRPNLTPAEVLRLGSFGGTYFRPIRSGVTGASYTTKEVLREYPKEWFEGIDVKMQLGSKTYRIEQNRYRVKCGGSLDMWEGSGWISPIDPYGWFQWYCRFYLGRRSTDDDRQIKRGLGVMGIKGRFRNQLISKCARGGTSFDDERISPVIRQSLQHWGYVLTKRDADKYIKLKKLPALKAKPRGR